VAEDGTVYVADHGNARVEYFNATGVFQGKWGSNGVAPNQFSMPQDVFVSDLGDVFVTDHWRASGPYVQHFDPAGTLLYYWGDPGTGPSQFDRASGVGVATNGTVYVADSGNNRVQVFSSEGVYQSGWGSVGTGPSQFNSPDGVAVGPGGRVYVVDSGNHRVQYFSATGAYQGEWGTNGTGDGQFQQPMGIAVAPNADVYVVDSGNSRIQYFRGDLTRPTPRALKDVTVKRLKNAVLRFRVNDKEAWYAKVVIKIYQGTKLKKSITLRNQDANTNLTYSFKCKLAKGSYKWTVFATDLAGKKQAKTSSKKLVVK